MAYRFVIHRRRLRNRLIVSAFSIAALSVIAGMALAQESSSFRQAIPKTWDEKMLADWATPLAGLNVRPSHISAEQYYALPVDNLKTYPVYLAGREPEGYWRMLSSVGPKPMIEAEKLKTEADWIVAGR